MALSLSTHAAVRPHARGAAHADGQTTAAAHAMPHAGVMDSARMVAQRQRMADVSGAASAVSGGTIQRMTQPSASSPSSTQSSTSGSSSTDDDTARRTAVIHYTGAAAMPKPPSREPSASVRDPED